MLLIMTCPFLGTMMEMERPTLRCGDLRMGIGILFDLRMVEWMWFTGGWKMMCPFLGIMMGMERPI
jgi:hypothetical protein